MVFDSTDGYEYELFEIAGQCWFKENLQTNKYSDGNLIDFPGITSFLRRIGLARDPVRNETSTDREQQRQHHNEDAYPCR